MRVKIPLLLIGKEVGDPGRERIHMLKSFFKDSVLFEEFGPALDEWDILDTVDKIAALKPAMVLMDILQGGSARAVALAALKSGVPAVIWCHDGKHSLASASIASGALEQLDRPGMMVHGEISRMAQELDEAIRAATALKKLKDARIGQMGPLHYNLVNSTVNPLCITSRFGTWVVPLSVAALKKQAADMHDTQVRKELEDLRKRYCVEAGDDLMARALKIRLALRDTALKHRLDAVAVDCWNEIIPEMGVNPCLEFAYNEFLIACEGDVILALTMLAGEAICGTPGYCGDFYSFDESDGTASLMHCTGSTRLHGGSGCHRISVQEPPNSVGPCGCLAVPRPELVPGPGVILILHGSSLEYLHMRKCEIIRTDFSNQMQVFVKIEGDTGSFRKEAAGNHYTVFTGNCMDAWRLWAAWSGVTVH